MYKNYHPRGPRVVAADYNSTTRQYHGTSLCKTPLLISAIDVGHEECDRPLIMLYNLGLFQHMLFIYRYVLYIKIENPTSRVWLSIFKLKRIFYAIIMVK